MHYQLHQATNVLLGDRGRGVNNLPSVVTWQWNNQELNPHKKMLQNYYWEQ